MELLASGLGPALGRELSAGDRPGVPAGVRELHPHPLQPPWLRVLVWGDRAGAGQGRCRATRSPVCSSRKAAPTRRAWAVGVVVLSRHSFVLLSTHQRCSS